MNETLKLYQPYSMKPGETMPITSKTPFGAKIAFDSAPNSTKHSKWRFFLDSKMWKEVFNENARREDALNQKYPWFEILYRWIVALCVIMLFISFIIWSINIYTERTAMAYAASEVEKKEAEHQAFLAQMEADKQAELESVENQMKLNAQAKARLGYGSRNFVEKYHYGDNDFMTLYQCVDNRLKNKMYIGMSIEDIVFQEGQFIASYDTNPVQDYYFNLAMKSERAKQNQVSEPVGSDYVYTIYTPHGIFLANDPNAPAYTWWHYSE